MTHPTHNNKAPPARMLKALWNHQRWLNSNGEFGQAIDGSFGFHYTELDLRGMDFSHADLGYAEFTNCQLDRATFSSASLFHATFTGCSLIEADFRGACLHGTRIDAGNELRAARFAGASVDDDTAIQGQSIHRDGLTGRIRSVWPEERPGHDHRASEPEPLL